MHQYDPVVAAAVYILVGSAANRQLLVELGVAPLLLRVSESTDQVRMKNAMLSTFDLKAFCFLREQSTTQLGPCSSSPKL